ncbi:T9SS type A sorting domain-containing protein [Flavobacterium cerinum]|nr:T9SS type A sorting domain-containing protein [Flavobacterium cerinum]
MKKLYIWFAVIMPIFLVEAQNLQNANWDFGYGLAFEFLPYPQKSSSVDMTAFASCATVSDQSGKKLFHTNGRSIVSIGTNSVYYITSNDLKGDFISTQGVIIVPKPGDSDNYYVVTLDGVQSMTESFPRGGLYYSEVDMALNGGLGGIVAGAKNIPLKDHNGVIIDENYTVASYVGNYSEKLTATVQSNGNDYWIVTQIDRYIYSYKVTSAGITLVPNSYTQTVNTVTNDLLSGIGGMKISPDTQRIAIAYHDGVQNSIQTKALIPSNRYPGVVLGSFNNTTGKVILDEEHPIIITKNNGNPYGVEFSPDSSNIYFSAGDVYNPNGDFLGKKIYYTTSQYDVLNYVSFDNGIYDLQLGIDNKIYFTNQIGNRLGVINNPNNILAPTIVEDAYLYGSGTTVVSRGLPQWVHWQQSGCTSILTLTTANNVVQGQNNRQASNTLNAANVITENGSANYHAGTAVVLKPGFHGASGASFRGYIEGCSGQFSGLRTTEEDNQSFAKTEVKQSLFTLSPNPAADRTVIASDKMMVHVEVKSLTGTIFYSGKVNDKSHELYIGNYPKGFYMVMVTTDTGEVEVKKLIKD